MNLQEMLAKHPQLGALSTEERDALVAAMEVGEHEQGHIFIQEGGAGDTLFLIVEGEVWVTRARKNATHDLKLLKTGELFGLIALLDNEPRSASCVAAGKVKAAALSRATFEKLYYSHAPVAVALQNALAAQLTDDFRHLTLQIAEELARAQ